MGVAQHQRVGPGRVVGKLALALDGFEGVDGGALPEAVGLVHRAAHAVGADVSGEEADRPRQVAVLGEQTQEGAVEAAEPGLVGPPLQDRDDRLLGTQRHDAVGIHPHVARRALVAQPGDDPLVEGVGHRLAAAARLLVARVELVAVLQNNSFLAEGPHAGALDAGADAVRGEELRRLGRPEVVVVVAGNDGELRPLRELRQRLEGHRIALAHGGEQRRQLPAGRRLFGHLQPLEELPEALGRRLHGGEVEAVAEEDQLGPFVAGDALAQLGQLPALAVVGEEPGLAALVEMEVADRVQAHRNDGPQPPRKNKRRRAGCVR